MLLVLVDAQLGQTPPERLSVHHAVAHEDEGEDGDQKAAPLQLRLILLDLLADRQLIHQQQVPLVGQQLQRHAEHISQLEIGGTAGSAVDSRHTAAQSPGARYRV